MNSTGVPYRKKELLTYFFERQVISDQSWNNTKLDFLYNLSNVPVQGQVIKVHWIRTSLLSWEETRKFRTFLSSELSVTPISITLSDSYRIISGSDLTSCYREVLRKRNKDWNLNIKSMTISSTLTKETTMYESWKHHLQCASELLLLFCLFLW